MWRPWFDVERLVLEQPSDLGPDRRKPGHDPVAAGASLAAAGTGVEAAPGQPPAIARTNSTYDTGSGPPMTSVAGPPHSSHSAATIARVTSP